MLKIAITGPESTGKSELCEALANYYETEAVPEFARTFLHGRKPPYEMSDLDKIAEGQRLSEIKAEIRKTSIIFYDTEMTVMKIWSEHAFGFCSEKIKELYHSQQFDLYLLMNIDLPWQPDPLREHPHLREHFFLLYKQELEDTKKTFKIISGIGNDRIKNAIRAIEHFKNVQ